MHNEYGLTWLDSVDVEAMSPTQVSRWTMYARYGFMELRIKEAVWRFQIDTYDNVMDHATPQIATRRNQRDSSKCRRLAGYLR